MLIRFAKRIAIHNKYIIISIIFQLIYIEKGKDPSTLSLLMCCLDSLAFLYNTPAAISADDMRNLIMCFPRSLYSISILFFF